MKLSVTKAITGALAFSLRHAVPFYLLGLVVSLPSYLHSFLPRESLTLTLPGRAHEEMLPRPWWETELAVPLVEAMLLGVLVAIMVHSLQRDRRGDPRAVWPILTDVAPRLPTILGVSLIIDLAWALVMAAGEFLGTFGAIGAIPLMVLFAYLYLVFCVATPCAAVDNAGIIYCFERSAALTAGSRGRLFGVFAVSLLPALAAIAALILLEAGENFSVEGIPALSIWLVGAAVNVYFAALIVVLHEALVTLKEGAGAGTLATVFD